MLKTAHAAISVASKKLGLSQEQLEKILYVNAAHEFEITLKNGKSFKGFRMQHNNARGPYKGGIRFHPEVDFDEVRALATLMSLKTSLLNLPLGGGKGGIVLNPKELSAEELEELSRGYVRKLVEFIGPDKDVPAPDVNTNPKIIDWMVDEYSKLTGDETKASFTGKSIANGGSQGRDAATGRGGVIVLDTYLELVGDAPLSRNLTYAVQGFGNVGAFFADVASKNHKEWSLVAVSDSSGTLVKRTGLNVAKLVEYKKTGGRFADFKEEGVVHKDSEAILSTDSDVLVLAALGGAVNINNFKEVKPGIILELANGPVEVEAIEKLEEKNVVVIPDILANAGGVVVSYLEWVQNLDGKNWDIDSVNSKLLKYMQDATREVANFASTEHTSVREAAFAIAVRRLSESPK